MAKDRLSLIVMTLLVAFPIVGVARISAQPPQPKVSPEDVKLVRRHLGWIEIEMYQEALKQFRKIGEEKVFAAFESILLEPGAIRDLQDIFAALRKLKGDRRRFVEHAVRNLTYPHPGVRESAVALLADIGTNAEASPVVALLSDKHYWVAQSAATTLVAIGGSRELVAMDIWLAGVSRPNDDETRNHVMQCRAALQKRLDEAREKGEKPGEKGS